MPGVHAGVFLSIDCRNGEAVLAAPGAGRRHDRALGWLPPPTAALWGLGLLCGVRSLGILINCWGAGTVGQMFLPLRGRRRTP